MASRRNFPGRLEARRRRAAERSQGAVVCANTPETFGPALSSPEPQIEQPVRKPSQEPPLVAPVPPRFPEFGLSDEAVAHLPRPWFRVSPAGGAREIWSYLVADLCIFFLIFERNIHISFGWIMGFFGFSFIFVIPLYDLLGNIGSIGKEIVSCIQ
jgi:hypothetical protein